MLSTCEADALQRLAVDSEGIERIQARGLDVAGLVRELAITPAQLESLQAESIEALEGIGCLETGEGSAAPHTLRQCFIPPHEK